MSCIENSNNKVEFSFFFDSLVDFFQPTDESLWAFSVYFGRGLDGISSGGSKAIYTEPGLALRAAKLHALKTFVARSTALRCLTSYPNDCVLIQSGSAIEKFGRATNMEAINFYPNKQDRLDVLRDVRRNGKAEGSLLALADVDANRFEGYGCYELIEIDNSTSLLLEHVTIVDTHG